MKKTLITLALGALAASHAAYAATTVATFDDLPLAPESHFFPQVTTTFTSGAATFNHTFTNFGGGCCHVDWVYSNRTDTTTGNYTNQHSAITGGGADGSGHYAIANFGAPTVSFASAVSVQGAYFTNTTFTGLTLLTGDFFSKKFGGASGNDPDYLKLTILGKDAGGATTGSVDFMLADYRFDDNTQDYVVTDWRWVDLTALGSVSSLQFALASSDSGEFGINTPAYFALDNLTVTAVPEPEQAALLLAGLALVGAIARRRRG
ncbi:DUF4465 domain-containing protein [Methyloversatilis sp.]|uniref:DUF4465 domain-containing protein n=1 Tax=Methyloversatilis sp. TaxID=2569862 RepID=UPI0027342227|nr:DUF4465 domain-containing protein [Methyloversatilis sp.]MDP2867864.1 DUF4465 domain-containing protein [Methyloversatilis sp.]MDP3289768.1 DUF4465 domain-containing protein [Methyloversatilis sp.]MDP3454826.1 DUF4465 domain-containing protein [Methyloversatilis sp.]MDP3577016.1 DUF4465 domain-containing protein [Methyloversatilis sp.]